MIASTFRQRALRQWQCHLQRTFSTQKKAFDRGLKRIHRDAVPRFPPGYDYLREETARRLLDRLNDIMKDFPVAVDLGCGFGSILKNWSGHGEIEKLYMCDMSRPLLLRDQEQWPEDDPVVIPVVGDEEFLPFQDSSVDLVVSNLALHWVNDVPGVLSQIQRVLKPDGVFIGAMLGGQTLSELASSFVAAELEREGGVSMHVSPMMELSDCGNLLSGAKFTLPTVDRDLLTLEYPSPFHLMNHVQAMGESNANVQRRRSTPMDTFLSTAAIYQTWYDVKEEVRDEDDNPHGVEATFEVLYMTGWKSHASQPKPLERGAFQMNLKEAIAGEGQPPKENAGE